MSWADDEGLWAYRPRRRSTCVMCRLCNTKYLGWREVNGRWVLFENGKPHVCPDSRDKDFEVLKL